MHRMRRLYAKVGLTLTLLFAAPLMGPNVSRADLIRPTASQSFPDLSGDIVGTQNYVYNAATGMGVFTVNSAPSLLALGPQQSSEYYVYDPTGQARSQSLQLTLDSSGRLVTGANNTYSLYGSVTVDGHEYNGLLLQGTPTAFGFASPNPSAPTMSVYDVSLNLTGGQLQEAFGKDAYLRIIAETNSTFDGTFTRDFSGRKTLTNVRAYNAPSPRPIPEPSTFALLLACGGAGLLYKRSLGRVALADLDG
jgi:hypothetical protein